MLRTEFKSTYIFVIYIARLSVILYVTHANNNSE